MKKTILTLALTASVMLPGSAANANDLIKALSLLQAASNNSRYDYGRRPLVVPPRTSSSCRSDRDRDYLYGRSSRSASLEASRLRALERAERLARLERQAELERLERLDRARRTRSRSTIGLRVGYQEVIPTPPTRRLPGPAIIPPSPVPALPPISRSRITVPTIPSPIVPRHPHVEFGEVVTCEVPLYRRLRVRDRHNIARGARPMVVAVKAPGACDHACSCCANEIVYVRVMAPPCPPKCVTVSPCGRHVRMDFGKYEIDIVSMANLVKVDYDN